MRYLAWVSLWLAFSALATAQKEEQPPQGEPAEREDVRRVLPVYDPGSHTRPIAALGFTKDKSKLVTVGQDHTVQIWSTATGERLDILRLPGYGREKGFDTARWNLAAVSPDGTVIAIGGAGKLLGEKANERTRLIVVSLPTRTVRRVRLRQAKGHVTALSFSPDGRRLAVGFGGEEEKQVALVHNLHGFAAKGGDEESRLPTQVFAPGHTKTPTVLAFSPDSKRLAIGETSGRVSIWEVLYGVKNKPKLLKAIEAEGRTTAIDWSPDGSKFFRVRQMEDPPAARGIEFWGGDGSLLKKWRFNELAPAFRTSLNMFMTARFLGPDTVFLAGTGGISPGVTGIIGATVDLTAGKTTRHFSEESPTAYYSAGAVSKDGDLAAVTVTMGTEAVIFRVKDGQGVVRCGNRTPIPTLVGWSAEPKAPGFAWSDEVVRGRSNTKPENLRYGFDLVRVEPVPVVRPDDYSVFRHKVGPWSIEYPKSDQLNPGFRVMRGTTVIGKIGEGRNVNAATLIPNGDKEPLVAWASRYLVAGGRAYLCRADGKHVASLLPPATRYRDLAPSPDGRYLIASTGGHRLAVFPTNGSSYALLSFVSVSGAWAAWTPEGYYAANPGGEKMIGWAVHNGPEELVTFHPADKFAAHFRRPDVIKLAIEKGSVAAALAALKTKPRDVEPLLPPKAELMLLKQNGATVQVKALATPSRKDKPVEALRVLLDGRPLPEGRGVLAVPAGKPAEAVWQFEVPPGTHELKLLARGADGPAVSSPLVVYASKMPGMQPTLFRVCVGINAYEQSGLKLNAAARDAGAVYDALAQNCVGPDNRFGKASGAKLLDEAATRSAVLKALADVRKAAKPGDLVIFFFAGHGIKQDNTFYLLTREADLGKSLKGRSLSGDDLRKAFADMECPVLLLLDACHSAGAVRSFRPATDDLTRSLTDDSAGVTVLAAAMAHEVASATAENGHFTAALLKALQAGEGVPFDPYEKALYTHHIYSVIFSEVRKATGGKQNPFLNMPWTAPPLLVREVAKP